MAKKKSPNMPIIVIIGIIFIFTSVGLLSYKTIPKIQNIGINQISNESGDVVLSLIPSNLTAQLNSELVISLTAKTGDAKLVVLAAELTYDPTKITAKTVDRGSFLSNTIVSPKIDNGKITFTYSASPETGGAQGSGEIAKIKFNPIEPGNSTISITKKTVATSTKDGQRIPTNSLKSSTDSIVLVEQKIDQTSKITPSSDTPIPPVNNSDNDLTNNPPDDIVDTTNTSNPNIFQKVAIGWTIIFKYISNLVTN
jgi:hypothetical protein